MMVSLLSPENSIHAKQAPFRYECFVIPMTDLNQLEKHLMY